jgi:hypothetical protein
LPKFVHDRVKARELQPDGSYRRLKPEGKEPREQAQWHFREVSREHTKKMSGSKKKKLRADKLIPISVADAISVAAAERQPGSPIPATTPKQSP